MISKNVKLRIKSDGRIVVDASDLSQEEIRSIREDLSETIGTVSDFTDDRSDPSPGKVLADVEEKKPKVRSDE